MCVWPKCVCVCVWPMCVYVFVCGLSVCMKQENKIGITLFQSKINNYNVKILYN